MGRKTKAEKQLEIGIEVGVQLVEAFRKMTGFSDEQFLSYMNTYNIWSILNDVSVVLFIGHEGEAALLDTFGRYLSDGQRAEIISRNNIRI